MSDWRSSTWGEEITLEYGKALRSYSETGGQVQVFGTNGPIGWTDTPLTNGPGVILGRKGAYRGVHYSKNPFFVIDTAYFVRPKSELDMQWLYYAIIHHQLGKIDDGSPIPSTTRAAVYPRPLEVPRIKEQRAIAAVLGALDDKIRHNRKAAQDLESLARAIFKAWFLDFDPVKAKAAGATSFQSMSQAVFDTLPNRLIETDIGLIPYTWELTPLTELFDINPSYTLRKGETAPYLDMKNMPINGHSPDEVGERPFGSGTKFVNGDTLIARITPCLENGKTAFVDFLPDGAIGWGSTEYIVLKPKVSIPPIFAYLLARTNEFRSFAIQSMTGTSGRQRVPYSALQHFKIPAPPEEILTDFGNLINPIIARSSAYTRESHAIAQLRDSLLPKLMSGFLRVPMDVCDEDN